MSNKETIENKIINIEKENYFSQYWSLFKMINPILVDRYNDNLFDFTKLVNAITYADVINIVISDLCLNSVVLNELIWVSSYIKINLIAKNKNVIDSYSQLNVNVVKIDDSINFNYIHIEGRDNLDCIINNDYYLTNDYLNQIYFNNQTKETGYSFLNSCKTLFIIGLEPNNEIVNLIKEAKEKNINVNYVFSIQNFNLDNLNLVKSEVQNIYLTDRADADFITIDKNDDINMVLKIKENIFVNFKISCPSEYLGTLYEHLNLTELNKKDKKSKNLYSCYKGRLIKLDFKPLNTINQEVQISTMKDFVNEEFDKSIVDSHNDFANEFIKTKYVFTLIPPLLTRDYKRSNIYEGFDSLISKLNEEKTIKIESLKSEFAELFIDDDKLLQLLSNIQKYITDINKIEKNKAFLGYKSISKKIFEDIVSFKDGLINYCCEIYSKTNGENTNSKFSEFDDEINGYKNTILEKQNQIDKGINVLANKHRIDNLKHKIEHLLELKSHFESNNDTRDNKYVLDFKNKCQLIIDDKYVEETNEDSLGNVIKVKETSKKIALEKFIKKYLSSFNKWLINLEAIIKDFCNLDLPEGYVVLDYRNQKYIAIDSLQEYKNTKTMCEKYDLSCIARR